MGKGLQCWIESLRKASLRWPLRKDLKTWSVSWRPDQPKGVEGTHQVEIWGNNNPAWLQRSWSGGTSSSLEQRWGDKWAREGEEKCRTAVMWEKGSDGKGVWQDLMVYSKSMVKTLPFILSKMGSIGEFWTKEWCDLIYVLNDHSWCWVVCQGQKQEGPIRDYCNNTGKEY